MEHENGESPTKVAEADAKASTQTETEAKEAPSTDRAADAVTGARAKEGVWATARGTLRKPYVGLTLTGASVVAVGALVGLTEALVVGAAVYGLVHLIKRRASSTEKTDEAQAA
jgi:hypothetical protein